MPAWRIASRFAACSAVSSGSRSPASAGRARPRPAPAIACGRTVHQSEAPGQEGECEHAAGDEQRAGRGADPWPGRRTRAASTAAIGSTVTAAAAASGSVDQPVTSSSTSRKSTPTSAAERSASAVSGRERTSGIEGGGLGRRLSTLSALAATNATIEAARAIGTWARKIARQSKACVSAPPSAGPAAKPKIATAVHTRRRGAAGVEQRERADQQRRPAQRLHAAQHEQGRRSSRRPRSRRTPPRTRARRRPPACARGRRVTSGSATASTSV